MTKLKLTDNTTIPICISWDASVEHGFTGCYQAVWGNSNKKIAGSDEQPGANWWQNWSCIFLWGNGNVLILFREHSTAEESHNLLLLLSVNYNVHLYNTVHIYICYMRVEGGEGEGDEGACEN